MRNNSNFLGIRSFSKKSIFRLLCQCNNMIKFLTSTFFKRLSSPNPFVIKRNILKYRSNDSCFHIETLLRVVKVGFRGMNEIKSLEFFLEPQKVMSIDK